MQTRFGTAHRHRRLSGGGCVLPAALFLTGVHCLHAVCIPLESQPQPLPSTPPPTRLQLLPLAVWSGCTSLPGPLCLVRPSGGKRPRRRRIINTTSTGGRLLHLKDELTGLLFLVDTGASRSLIPHQSAAPASGPHLITADGQPISAWGTHKQTLQIGSFHFSFPFVLAAVAFPILGNDFLATHHLLVNPAQPAVIDCPSAPSFLSHRRLTPLLFSTLFLTPPLFNNSYTPFLLYCFFLRFTQPVSSPWCSTPHSHLWAAGFCQSTLP